MKSIINWVLNINTCKSIIVLGLLMTVFVGSCSKDDDPDAESISASAQTFQVNGLNNCSTAIGTGSTFVLTIPYTAPEDTSISRLLIRTEVSDGSSEEAVNTQFTDENNSIIWATCFHFGSQTWVEYEVRLESSNGSMSNPSVVRINKPDGAN